MSSAWRTGAGPGCRSRLPSPTSGRTTGFAGRSSSRSSAGACCRRRGWPRPRERTSCPSPRPASRSASRSSRPTPRRSTWPTASGLSPRSRRSTPTFRSLERIEGPKTVVLISEGLGTESTSEVRGLGDAASEGPGDALRRPPGQLERRRVLQLLDGGEPGGPGGRGRGPLRPRLPVARDGPARDRLGRRGLPADRARADGLLPAGLRAGGRRTATAAATRCG